MNWIALIRARASLWIDHVALALLAWREALRPPRFARLAEQDDGAFALEQVAAPPAAGWRLQWPGSRTAAAQEPAIGKAAAAPVRIADGAVAPADAARLAPLLARARLEIVLRPERFLFRPLQLPRRAADFLEAIIRSQIDRLTPWSAADAAFGFRPDAGDGDGDRLNVTIAATARTMLSPFVEAARGLGVEAVSIATPAPDGGATISVLEQKIEGAVEARRLRRGLALALGALAAAAIASVAAAALAGGEFEARRDEALAAVAQRRAALNRGVDANSAAAEALRRRKHETPASVIVYEELSRILPDDAYLTELRIEGDKAQIVGIARDAPELIHILERSPHFKAATFFAPTTGSPAETGQHFFIEAHVRPVFPAAEAPGQ